MFPSLAQPTIATYFYLTFSFSADSILDLANPFILYTYIFP